MTKDSAQLLKIQNAVKQMIANGEPTDYIDSFLASQGESPESLHALNTAGAERLAEVRKNAEKPAKPTVGERFRAAGGVVKDLGDYLTSMGQEYLKDFSAGVLTPASYEDLKSRVKEQAAQGGTIPRYTESTARGLAGAAGLMASPLFRAGKLIPGVGRSLLADSALGGALYSGVKKAGEGGTPSEIAFDTATGGVTGLAGGGVAKLGQNTLATVLGASTGLGSQTLRDITRAGERGSKTFRAGQKMSDAEFTNTIQNAAREVKSRATQQLTEGKNAIGNKPVNKKSLFAEYQNYYNRPESVYGRTFMGTNETKHVFDTAEGYIKKFGKIKNPTVNDIHRLKVNIGSIPAEGEALAARTELYNITKNAADAATAGGYSKVMEPYAKTMMALDDFSRAARNSQNVSQQTNAILRNMKTEFGRDSLSKILGQDNYDLILGKATQPWFTGRTGAITTGASLLSGNLPVAATMGTATSPRFIGNLAFGAGKLLPEASEIIKPLSVGASDLTDMLKLY